MNKLFKEIISVTILVIIFFTSSVNCGRSELYNITSQLEALSLAEKDSPFWELCDDLMNIILSQDSQESVILGKVCKRWNKIFNLTIKPMIVDFSKNKKTVTHNIVISTLKNHTNLRFINLGWCEKIKNKTIKEIANLCPLLRYINLSHCYNIKKEAIEFLIQKCPHLQYINIEWCKKIKEPTIEKLALEYPEVYIKNRFISRNS